MPTASTTYPWDGQRRITMKKLTTIALTAMLVLAASTLGCEEEINWVCYCDYSCIGGSLQWCDDFWDCSSDWNHDTVFVMSREECRVKARQDCGFDSVEYVNCVCEKKPSCGRPH
jgi:hypothetical protein